MAKIARLQNPKLQADAKSYYVVYMGDGKRTVKASGNEISFPIFTRINLIALRKLGGDKKIGFVPATVYSTAEGNTNKFFRDESGQVWKTTEGRSKDGNQIRFTSLVVPPLSKNKANLLLLAKKGGASLARSAGSAARETAKQYDSVSISVPASVNAGMLRTFLVSSDIEEKIQSYKVGKIRETLSGNLTDGKSDAVPLFIPIGQFNQYKVTAAGDASAATGKGGLQASDVIYAVTYKSSAKLMGFSKAIETKVADVEKGTTGETLEAVRAGSFANQKVFQEMKLYSQIWRGGEGDTLASPISAPATGKRVRLAYNSRSKGRVIKAAANAAGGSLRRRGKKVLTARKGRAKAAKSSISYAYISVPKYTPISLLILAIAKFPNAPSSIQVSNSSGWGKSYPILSVREKASKSRAAA